MTKVHRASVKKKKRTIVEILEPDVTRVEPNKKRTIKYFKSILIRLMLAVLFLALGVGAVVYSVVHSEEIAEREKMNHYVKCDYLNHYRNQSALEGTLTMERRIPDPYNIQNYVKNITKIGVSWLQDDTNRRIVHQVGLTNLDWKYTYYVYDKYSIYATRNSCVRNSNQNYDSFLSNFGISNLSITRHEQIILEDKARPVSVDIYQGALSSHPIGNAYTYFTNYLPYFATVYVKPSDGMFYGWQVYFKPSNDSTMQWMEYWFPSVSENIPDTAVFYDIPSHCIVRNT